jgi:hypothetical protein
MVKKVSPRPTHDFIWHARHSRWLPGKLAGLRPPAHPVLIGDTANLYPYIVVMMRGDPGLTPGRGVIIDQSDALADLFRAL